MLPKSEVSTGREADLRTPVAHSNFAPVIRILCYTACVIAPLTAIAAALLHLRQGWDDGAITAAFSRTFHETGRFALTPFSETVEGFSSMLWMLILAMLDNVSHTVDAMLVSSKIASVIAFALSILVFARLTKRFLNAELRYLAIVLFALLITPFREVINGMEMNLYTLLVLILTEILLNDEMGSVLRWSAAAVTSFALLLTRFEAPGLIVFLYVGIFLATRRKLGITLLAVADVMFFGLTEAWRHMTFGLWMPNTVFAKQWPPYSNPGLHRQLLSRGNALSEFAIVLAVPLITLIVLIVAARLGSRRSIQESKSPTLSPVLVSMITGGLLIALAVGRNWGHIGRMHMGFLPFFIIALVAASGRLLPQTRFRLQPVVLSIIMFQAIVWIAEAKITAFHSVPFGPIERSGLANDELRRILQKDTLSVFIPDVGGSALCCEKLNIMDSAMLANPALAHSGLAGTLAYVAAHDPDVIQTNFYWARLDGLYAPHALDGYGEVQIRGKTLFLRNDLYEQVKQRGFAETLATNGVIPCGSAAEAVAETADDKAFVRTQKRCILISR